MRTFECNFENNFLILHVNYEGPFVGVTQNALSGKRTYSPTPLQWCGIFVTLLCYICFRFIRASLILLLITCHFL